MYGGREGRCAGGHESRDSGDIANANMRYKCTVVTLRLCLVHTTLSHLFKFTFVSIPSGRDLCCGSLKQSQFIIIIFVRNTKLSSPRSKRTWTLPVGSDPQLGISDCTILHYTTAYSEILLCSSNYTLPPHTAECSWLLCNALSHSPGVFHRPGSTTL